MYSEPKNGPGFILELEQSQPKREVKTTSRSWFVKTRVTEMWNQTHGILAKNHETPSPDDQTQTGGNWCRQRNGCLHWFPQQSNVVCKTSTNARVIIAKLRNPPSGSHTIYLEYIQVGMGKPRKTLIAETTKVVQPIKWNRKMGMRAYLALCCATRGGKSVNFHGGAT